jgi:hypothetical protein
MKKQPDPQLPHVNRRRRASWILLLAGLWFLISFASSEFFGLPYWRIPFAHPYVAVLLAAVLVLLGLRVWRCPRCGGYLGALKARACTYCGLALTPEASRATPEPADPVQMQAAFRHIGDSLARHKAVTPLEVLAGLAVVVAGLFLKTESHIFMVWVLILLLGIVAGVAVYQLRYLLALLYYWRCPACGKYLPAQVRGWFGFFGAEADFEASYCPYCRVHLSGGEEP